MLRVTFLVLLLLRFSSSFAAELVPESTSPDGRYALAFERPQSKDSDPPPLVWFVRLPELAHVSAQLTPTDEVIYQKKRIRGVETLVYRNERTGPNADNRQMTFETLVSGVQARLTGEGTAANYQVLWSRDSRRVTIWAGEHKFAHASVFQIHHGKFRRQRDYFTYALTLSVPSAPVPHNALPRTQAGGPGLSCWSSLTSPACVAELGTVVRTL